jgi:hypothetical protein
MSFLLNIWNNSIVVVLCDFKIEREDQFLSVTVDFSKVMRLVNQ